jgi:hypothetical protein
LKRKDAKKTGNELKTGGTSKGPCGFDSHPRHLQSITYTDEAKVIAAPQWCKLSLFCPCVDVVVRAVRKFRLFTETDV